jgi:hypothetical protein
MDFISVFVCPDQSPFNANIVILFVRHCLTFPPLHILRLLSQVVPRIGCLHPRIALTRGSGCVIVMHLQRIGQLLKMRITVRVRMTRGRPAETIFADEVVAIGDRCQGRCLYFVSIVAGNVFFVSSGEEQQEAIGRRGLRPMVQSLVW